MISTRWSMRERDPTSKFLLAFLSSPSGDSPFTYLISHHIISVEHVVIMTDTSDEVFQSAATVMLRLARASVWSWMLGILCGCFTLCPWCRCICSCEKVHGMSSLCDWITRYHELLIVEVIIRSCFVFFKRSSQQILPSTSSIFGPNWGLSSRKCDGWPLDEVRWHSTPGGSKQLWCLWPKVCDRFCRIESKECNGSNGNQ